MEASGRKSERKPAYTTLFIGEKGAECTADAALTAGGRDSISELGEVRGRGIKRPVPSEDIWGGASYHGKGKKTQAPITHLARLAHKNSSGPGVSFPLVSCAMKVGRTRTLSNDVSCV